MLLRIATERVTRNRIAWNRPGTGTVRDRFRIGPNRKTVKQPKKKLPEPWNHPKKTAWIEPKNREPEPESVRVNRPNETGFGSMEPEPENSRY